MRYLLHMSPLIQRKGVFLEYHLCRGVFWEAKIFLGILSKDTVYYRELN